MKYPIYILNKELKDVKLCVKLSANNPKIIAVHEDYRIKQAELTKAIEILKSHKDE